MLSHRPPRRAYSAYGATARILVVMREILDYARCSACGAAKSMTILDRGIDELGLDSVAIWSEPLPAHDCEKMRALWRETWPVAAW